MKKLLVSFIVLFAGLLLVTQTSPFAAAMDGGGHRVAGTTKPAKLKQFIVEDAGLTTMDVSWKKHKADGTQVRVMTEAGELVMKKNTKKRASVVIEGLTAGTTYTLKARAYNLRGDGERVYGKYSATITASTDEEVVDDEEEQEEEEEEEQEEEDEPAETFDVNVENFAFSPDSLSVSVGDTVKFTNNDSSAHTASEENGVFNTGTLSTGESVEIVMDQAGTFDYFCAFHPSMTGTITVTE